MAKKKGQKVKSKAQVGFLLSDKPGVSPLSSGQKEKLKDELHTGKVKVMKGPRHKPKKPKHRQEGGPVSKGNSFIVGEAGPEVFVPNQDGTIIPNKKKKRKKPEGFVATVKKRAKELKPAIGTPTREQVGDVMKKKKKKGNK